MSEQKELERKRKMISARCDVFQDEGKVQLIMEMPGVGKDDLNIRVDNDMLVIQGNKKDYRSDGEFRIKEIVNGDYYNEFTLDNTIDRENIDASINNGVVTIDLKIKESEKPRIIKVVSK